MKFVKHMGSKALPYATEKEIRFISIQPVMSFHQVLKWKTMMKEALKLMIVRMMNLLIFMIKGIENKIQANMDRDKRTSGEKHIIHLEFIKSISFRALVFFQSVIEKKKMSRTSSLNHACGFILSPGKKAVESKRFVL
jgi:hypothetical protein